MNFLATFDTDLVTPSDPIVFPSAPLNNGNHYDVTTGIYTVPVDGVYEIILHLASYLDSDFAAYIDVDNDHVRF